MLSYYVYNTSEKILSPLKHDAIYIDQFMKSKVVIALLSGRKEDVSLMSVIMMQECACGRGGGADSGCTNDG